MAEWSIPPEQMAETPKEMIRDVRRVFAFDMFSKVVARTPVDSGNTRQNWLVTLNDEDFSYDPSLKKGQQVLAKGARMIDQAKGDDKIIVQNNAPPVTKLEYGGYGKYEKGKQITKADGPKTVNGFSRQAPKGMVGVTMAKANQLWEKAVKSVRSWWG